MATRSSSPPAAKLPDQYDALIDIERLIHGEHNPRNVPPTDELRASIETDGIDRPLIVRPDAETDRYHITDGWQRYQAAIQLGWERLPVSVYESPLEALAATERTSLGREWTTYDRAQFYRSIAAELETDGMTVWEIACQIAEKRAPTAQTIRRYLDALALPTVVHPLFNNGPDGTESQWYALKNHNESVRRYGGLRWRVAGRLGRRAREHDLAERRIIAIAANAVQYDTDTALEFIEAAATEPELSIEAVKQRIQHAGRHEAYFQVPSVAVELSDREKQALMQYCADQRCQVSSLVESLVQGKATELAD
jgi:ParB/RepB/Spo0J family partition protein